MTAELDAMARARGVAPTIMTRVVDGALAALKAGAGAEHDALIARAAADFPAVDAIVLAQFSMARAAAGIAPVKGRRVLTTPASAVVKLRGLVRGKDGGPRRRSWDKVGRAPLLRRDLRCSLKPDRTGAGPALRRRIAGALPPRRLNPTRTSW